MGSHNPISRHKGIYNKHTQAVKTQQSHKTKTKTKEQTQGKPILEKITTPLKKSTSCQVLCNDQRW